MDRRHFVGMVAATSTAGLAGCGFLTGEEALSFSASAALPTDDALSETGYEQASVEEQVVTQEFTVADQTREVEVSNQLAQYERQVSLEPLDSQRGALFVTFASPEVEVLGETFNPIEDLAGREVLQQFESQYEGLSVGDQVGSQDVTTLGQSTTLQQFAGSATLAGTEVDVYLHTAKFDHEGDYIVVVGIYPQQLDSEAQNVVTLLESLEHSGDE